MKNLSVYYMSVYYITYKWVFITLLISVIKHSFFKKEQAQGPHKSHHLLAYICLYIYTMHKDNKFNYLVDLCNRVKDNQEIQVIIPKLQEHAYVHFTTNCTIMDACIPEAGNKHNLMLLD